MRAGNCDIGAYEVLPTANVCQSGQTTPAPCSYTQTVTFNVATGPVTWRILTQGATGLDFSLSDTNGIVCYTSQCIMNVKFAPTAPGLRLGAVYLIDTNGNTIASADIYGIGDAPAVAFPGGPQTTVASASSPAGVALDGFGNLFVSLVYNSGSFAFEEFPAAGGEVTIATDLDYPGGISVDGAGNVFVTDSNNNRVLEFPAGCTSSACQITVPTSGLNQPSDVFVDGAGNLFITDQYNYRVVEEPAGCQASPCQTVVLSQADSYFYPLGVAVDAQGNLFTDDGVQNVFEFPTIGTLTTLGTDFSDPDGLRLDAADDVFVADFFNSRVQEIPAGCASNACQVTVGTGFRGPEAVAIDGRGNVYVADGGNGRVVEVQRSQPPTLAFGTVTDGNTSTAQTVSIQNIGNQALTFTSIGITLDSADFTLASGTPNACPTFPSSLAPGGICNVGVECAPENTGSLSGTLTLADNALNATSGAQAIPLSCMGQSPAVNTSTSISSSQNPSYTNGGANSVTFTATVTSSQVVNEGTVAFTANGNDISGCTAVVSNGVARCTTSFTTEGTYSIEAAYSGYTGATSFGPSSGTLSQTVANKTEVSDNGSMFCNPAGPATPSTQGAATPYPSEIFVSNFTGNIVNMTVELYGISSSNLPLTDLLLVGPTGATIVPFGGIGDNSTISEVNVTLSDSASSLLPSGTALASGTYKPTSLTSDLSFPAPAPGTFVYAAPEGSTTLASAFGSTSPNGTWQLFAIADGTDGVASISGGWCVTFPATPSVSVAGATTSYGSTAGQPVSATFTGSGGVAPSGTVSFSAATGSFLAASCTSSGAVLSCSSTYTPSGTLAANTYTGYITASIMAAGGYTSASGTGTLTVNQQTPTVAVTNVSVDSEAYGSGTATTVTATLSWTGSGVAPTGGLSFSSTAAGGFGPASCIGTTSPISCSATFTPTATDAPNTYTLSANFSGDTNYATASSTQTNNFSIAKNSSVSLSITNVSTTYGSTTPVSVSTLVSWTGGGSAPTAADVSIGFVGSGTSIGGSVGVDNLRRGFRRLDDLLGDVYAERKPGRGRVHVAHV